MLAITNTRAVSAPMLRDARVTPEAIPTAAPARSARTNGMTAMLLTAMLMLATDVTAGTRDGGKGFNF